jgi:Sporulation and spore germination
MNAHLVLLMALVCLPSLSSPAIFEISLIQPKLREVKIYLWKPNDKSGTKLGLWPVTRTVSADAPLRPTLEALFAGATKAETKRGFSGSTFGMKLIDVTLKNQTALVSFSQPKDQTNYGSLGPMIFAEAIEKTAKQFSTVKKVEICAVGETLIDSDLSEPFPRCPN